MKRLIMISIIMIMMSFSTVVNASEVELVTTTGSAITSSEELIKYYNYVREVETLDKKKDFYFALFVVFVIGMILVVFYFADFGPFNM